VVQSELYTWRQRRWVEEVMHGQVWDEPSLRAAMKRGSACWLLDLREWCFVRLVSEIFEFFLPQYSRLWTYPFFTRLQYARRM
jgi:hypothetical protein